ncbi:MAG: hypothetical protein EBZ03_03725 [Betaproteobacteria bacterium]|nr:hypothetical protein [Betaproteobacteria bacterium]NBP61726.1 hypothetical protein [Betaproteobacteria bacterium]NCV26542.1 hypothetical protein [Betaproteobacteria bacterium]NCV57474.1 hypothetical protein [Betaproteobacteria bacterium]NCV60438.1 hypothetical protein [Betaproteobacteria bacterium]
MLWIVLLVMTLSFGVVLLVSGNARIPSELRNSLGPDQLETIREDLALRKHLGQLLLTSLAAFVTVWIAY